MNTSALPYPVVDPTLLLRSALERIRLLEAEVLRLQTKPGHGEKAIRVFQAGRLIRVPLSSVLYFKAEGNYTRIFMNGGQQYYVSRTLKSLVNEIDDSGLIRCHRSYLVNQTEIEVINRATGELFLKSGECIPMSRRFQRTCGKALFNGDPPPGKDFLAKPDCAVYKLNPKSTKTGFYI